LGAIRVRAQEITFLKLVQGEMQFQVPLYQRTYSWGREQLQQLWDDVSEVAEHKLAGKQPAPHFLGSIVLAPGALQAGGLQRWLVVDGQQRLTTLMLAFTALRDHYKAAGDTASGDRVHRQILVNEFQTSGDDGYRLLPTQADRGSYTACVGSTPQAGGADNVGAAYRFFRGVLAEEREDHSDAEWCAAVEDTLKHLLSIVEITAQQGDNVYRIFESINNTGVGLSQTDLLRNYIFMMLPTRGETVYHELWLPMQQDLGPKNLELLAWLDLVVRGNSRAKQGEIYREQQARLEALGGDETAIADVVRQLAVRAQQFMRILHTEREPSPALRTALERLESWGGRVHYPLALHLLGMVDDGKASADEAAAALRHVESYVVRRMIAQVSTTGLNRIFMESPKELETDLPPDEAVHRFLSGRRRRWPTDDELREAIKEKPFYWGGRPEQRVHVLRSFEESYGASEKVDFAQSPLTIEHVLPQNPDPAWFTLLAEETEDGETPEKLHDRLVHTLGNLTLSGDNSKLSNHPFQRKQQIYDSSVLRMNQEIAAEARWGKAEIHARAERLTERAVKLWPGPIRDGEPAKDSPSWAELHAALLAMPTGTWTTYGDLAELIGSHAMPVGAHLTGVGNAFNPHRVLTVDGRVAPGFRWADGDDEQPTPRELLEAEGIEFDAAGRANPACRLRAAELATLLGKDVPEDAASDGGDDAASGSPETDGPTSGERFASLLHQHQPDFADGVFEVLRFWERLGGHLEYGKAAETSCFPMLDAGLTGQPHKLWPFALYPATGTVEVVFQYLKDRSPFDDAEQRKELMRRLNAIDGIHLAEAKLELRPSFPLHVVAAQRTEICGVLEWFVHAAALDYWSRM
jgi:alkylated DNA nucleotide flippase Atl1